MSNDDSGPLQGTDTVTIRGWLGDLTYGEIHATIWGFGLTATGLWPAFLALLAFAFGARSSVSRDPKVDTDDLPQFVRRQIRRQPHYFLAGGALGYVASRLGYGLDPSVLAPLL